MAGGESKGGAPGGNQFGDKYNQHIGQMQKALEDSEKRIEELKKEADDLRQGLPLCT
jgi:hypothetical protein